MSDDPHKYHLKHLIRTREGERKIIYIATEGEVRKELADVVKQTRHIQDNSTYSIRCACEAGTRPRFPVAADTKDHAEHLHAVIRCVAVDYEGLSDPTIVAVCASEAQALHAATTAPKRDDTLIASQEYTYNIQCLACTPWDMHRPLTFDSPIMSTRQLVALLEAGEVRRLHSFPGELPKYSVGQHCYNALTLLLGLHPNPSKVLMAAMLWHDSAELVLGDVPAPAKQGDLAKVYAAREAAIEADQFPTLRYARTLLTPDDMRWLHAIDKLEFMCWVSRQVALGLTGLMGILAKCETAWEGLRALPVDPIPAEVRAFYNAYRNLELYP